MLPSMIRAVVFDLFDTLVDLRFEDLPCHEVEGRVVPASLPALHAALAMRVGVDFEVLRATLQQVDLELGKARYDEGREVPTLERFGTLLARLGLEDPELAAILTAVHMRVLRDVVSVPSHHVEVLASLRGRVALGLCSNFTHSETALAILEEAGLHAHLDAIAISDTVGWRKPRGEIFAAVLRELGVAREEVLHVGDSLSADVGGASAAGMRTAWLTRRVSDPEQALARHEGPPPHHSIRDLTEIPRLLAEGDKR